MQFKVFLTASAVALAGWAASASAQQADMPGMTMPAHTKARSHAPTKPAKKKRATKAHAATKSALRTQRPGANPMAMPTNGTSAEGAMPMDHSQMQHGTMTMPPPAAGPVMHMPMQPQEARPAQMGNMPMAGMHAGQAMTGAFGAYPMQRESSGTAWQPDSSAHTGVMEMSGNWMLMVHGVLNLVYDHQSGPRGDDKAFASGMLMGMARRPLGQGTLQLKAMISPDPLMGPRGYPLLLATGETADGRIPLLDRQHPHDLLMELSASASQSIGRDGGLFIYAGLPGEPAFGPPAFMHRESIMDSPEAPITHHWLDSTHISFGVVTAGLVLGNAKVEVSRFNGREPDQHRWNIEAGPLDSTAVRLSWNPTRMLALQASWGHFVSPEQLEPGVNQKRLSASALWASEVAPGWHAAATLAWGRKTVEHHHDDAFAAEASVRHDGWTVFGRGEMTENRELLGLEEHGPAYRVGKISLGAVRDFPVADQWSIGAGGLLALNFVPDSIAPRYGGTNLTGWMGFVRVTLD